MKKRILSLILALTMLLTMGTTALAADDAPADNSKLIAVTNVINSLLNAVFKGVTNIFDNDKLLTVDEYFAKESENFYEGTETFLDSPAENAKWNLGFGEESIVPESLKNGSKKFYTGGYFTQKVNAVYDDQGVNAIAMNDASGRGTSVFASVDGIGICNADIRAIREKVEEKLKEKGIESDINAINISATHCHTVLDTQGFGLGAILTKMFHNMIPFLDPIRSIDSEFYASMINGASDAIIEAYTSMQEGKLYYFETATIAKDEGKGVYLNDEYSYLTNKRYNTEGYQNFIACFKFVPDNKDVKPTVFANLGAHPTTIDRTTDKLSADYPAYMEEKINEAGMNFAFFQGAQSPISVRKGEVSSEEITNEVDAEIAADATHAPYRSAKLLGYEFARLVLEGEKNAKEIEPMLNVRMAECAVQMDYGLMQLGAVSKLLGLTTVKDSSAQSGYGIITEVGYAQIGTDIVLLTVPGELIPQLVFGNVVTAKDAYLGTDWTIPCSKDLVENKKVLVMGLCNDAIGYIVPDNDYAPFIADSLWNSETGEKLYGPAHRHYEEMLSMGSTSASSIMTAINKIIESEK